MGLGFLGIWRINLPSGERLVYGCDTGEGVMVENDSDLGIFQPSQTFHL